MGMGMGELGQRGQRVEVGRVRRGEGISGVSLLEDTMESLCRDNTGRRVIVHITLHK